MAIIKRSIITKGSEGAQKFKPSYTAGETIKWCGYFGSTEPGDFTQNFKHRVITQPGNYTLRYIPKRNENICPHENLCRNDHSSFIHKRQKV